MGSVIAVYGRDSWMDPRLTGSSKTAAARAEIGGDVGERPIGEECSQRGLNYERFLRASYDLFESVLS